MRVIPLGTSSGCPTIERSLSSVALVVDGQTFLLDCGEGTQRQMRGAGLKFSRVQACCISHLHGDHITGLVGLLMSMQLEGRTSPMALFGPPPLAEYLAVNTRLLHTGFDFPVVVTEVSEPAECLRTARCAVQAAPLDHRIPCLGYRLEEAGRPGRFLVERACRLGVPEGPLFSRLQSGQTVELSDGRRVAPEEVLGPPKPGLAVAYCVDTRPCEAAVTLAQKATLLIHDATFDHSMAERALETMHSTAREAALVASRAEAGALMLTHVSPRYTDAAPLLVDAMAVFPRTLLACDLVEIRLPLPSGQPGQLDSAR